MSGPYRTLLPERPVREAVRRRIHQRGGDGDLGLVLDLAALEERCTTAVAAAARHDVGLLCAVKACTRPEVLARAAGCGLGFDVANLPELERVQAFGTPVSLTSPAIPLAELPRLHAALRRRELQRWHCDSLGQLEALARACPGATVGVRVNLDGLPVPDDMPLWRDSRFGIRLEELPLARDIAAAHGCRLGYLHVHNGSERNDLASFVFAAGRIVEAARAHAIELDGLDLGGGLLVDATTGAMNAFFGAVRRAAGEEQDGRSRLRLPASADSPNRKKGGRPFGRPLRATFGLPR